MVILHEARGDVIKTEAPSLHRGAQHRRIDAVTMFEVTKEKARSRDDGGRRIGGGKNRRGRRGDRRSGKTGHGESLGRAGMDRPPGRSLDPRRLKPVPARLSLSPGHTPAAPDAKAR